MELEERATYQTLKAWALDAYFDLCRDSGVVGRQSHEAVLARVSYTFEEGFARPVEDIMWRAILLILSGGWHQEWEEHARTNIMKDIAVHGLVNLLADLPKDEAELFEHDLKVLKLT